ncbi:MAG: adenine phosphoribosyltransferase [Holosporaceae bacterium]|jgi:adenine phosphoribosyltransferase|nr:adenine phosphoribosyltransferase [Holosporaceae bacterium]
MQKLATIKESIITIPDYPKKGILFRDITGLLGNASVFKSAIELIAYCYKDIRVDKVVGIDARGFIFAAPVALALNAGFVPARKPGKLPRKVLREEYALEYGVDALEIHEDAISKGENTLIVDDLLATGGTAVAAANLIRRAGGEIVGAAFVINLLDLGGEKKLREVGVESFSLVSFEGE